jgi:hypothetical protein
MAISRYKRCKMLNLLSEFFGYTRQKGEWRSPVVEMYRRTNQL